MGLHWGHLHNPTTVQTDYQELSDSHSLEKEGIGIAVDNKVCFSQFAKKLNNVNEKSSNNNQTVKQANNRPYALWCILLNQIHTKNYKTDIETNKKN